MKYDILLYRFLVQTTDKEEDTQEKKVDKKKTLKHFFSFLSLCMKIPNIRKD